MNIYVEDQKKLATPNNKRRMLKRDMFEPIPRRIREVLKLKEKNFKSMKVSIKDFWFFLILLANNTILFHYFHAFDANYSTTQMRKVIITDLYTQTLPFDRIDNLEDVVYFLNNTLMGATLWARPAYTVNSFVKLIGVVRLRQLKLTPGTDKCMPAYELKGETVDRCEIEFIAKNMDVKNYNVRWAPFNHSVYVKIDRHAHAFLYQTSIQAKVYQKIVGYKSIPGGGYFTNLGRTPANHRKVLRQLVLKRWFANSTRFLFVDFVGYNPNTNLFNVVCLMMEISMTGDIMKHYTIHTIRAFETNKFKELIQYFLFGLLVVQTCNILARHAHKIRYCLSDLGAFQETVVMLIAIQTLCTYAYRSVKIKILMRDLAMAKRNSYVNMEEVISVEWWSTLTTALWCSQNMLHLIDVFHFNSHIRIFYFCIIYALDYIHICIWLTCTFLLSFSVAFHFILGQENFLFSNFVLSYVNVFAIPFNGHPNMEFEYSTFPKFIPYLMFTFYGYEYRFLITSMFAVIMVNSYHRARIRLFKENFRYSISLYLKERVMRSPILFDKDRALPKVVEKMKKKEEENVRKAYEAAVKEAEEARIAYEAELNKTKKGKKGKKGALPPPPPPPPAPPPPPRPAPG